MLENRDDPDPKGLILHSADDHTNQKFQSRKISLRTVPELHASRVFGSSLAKIRKRKYYNYNQSSNILREIWRQQGRIWEAMDKRQVGITGRYS